ncbi:tyrosine-protein kinase Btk29A isoform X1 [Zootermopsis nevadensis]|uniref:tyrosine-protein kinase Btk29A isoform X1 n=1 Tax=Zootermopsis nevadensis TaxID=136037 RepID=UPI000B8E25C2|nr:tyrosine-protein kinase Btk29A isoform X1 [Zootermopsis nevadensis]XP_021924477.1 tyrosine-protein kinase Btk29A isoform X1 [Zootermopsis nevadensis]XP_021924478.1 tyrosine-protein kinase Btk29A isoform X1 [Zootermopsis nevadensis]XP_021924479.1 tyrosine-protein kinase Btk29A isoform X1 [Zootermopsis nevadensis]XP_021924480.1 tyrosine-protein kinase Btk29A isoform X1 [Zootermopsis nevadensis]
MAGKDGGDEVVKQGLMVKRSQNKKKFTPVNYKQRWFVLTRSYLIYYDTDGEDVNSECLRVSKSSAGLADLSCLHSLHILLSRQRRKERGRIDIGSVQVVESAQLSGSGASSTGGAGGGDISLVLDGVTHPAGFPFQVGYQEGGQEYTLYLLANRDQDRAEWIRALRAVCSENSCLSERFHVGLWSGKRWTCCRLSNRSADGCDSCTSWSRTASTLGLNRNEPVESINNNPAALARLAGVPSAPNMPGGVPGTPSSKAKEKLMIRPKVVVALYPFKAIEGGDLSLEKGAEYEVLDDSQEHWWKVKDEQGSIGYIPSNYVKEKELLGLQKYEWYVGDMSRQRAESILKQEDKEGCFVVRNSSTRGLYTLSLYTKVFHPHVKHYHIKQNSRGEFFLSEKHCCGSIPDLVNYHKHNSGGLASRLKTSPCDRPVPATAGLSHDKWEIDPQELMLLEELGSGQFGVVRRGKWRGSIDVAVKMMKEGTMSEDDFIEEAKVMTKLQHQNLVQLYGVCSKHRPIYIVTEYMRHGSLLNYLRRHETTLERNVDMLLDMCIQICKGMAYLERHNYIHRDLAARNCLVGSENIVKVADFGLARYVLDDQYTSSGGTKFPIKWAPPEVLNYTRFSSKSDVWAYGVLMWEVFTCGKMPYGRLKNTEVVERVQRGIVLERPKACFKEVYEVMRKCWSHCPEDRPSFRMLKEQLISVSQGLLAD